MLPGRYGTALSDSNRTYTSVLAELVRLLVSTRSRCVTIRSAAFPSHFGGIAPWFHSPAINRDRAGGSLVRSVPIRSFVLIVMVSPRSTCRHSG